MVTSMHRKFWMEFFEIYKSLPCLWRTESEKYSNRRTRRAAYEKLITKLREIEPDANRYTVVRRVNTFRSNYRREWRKIDQSLKSGTGDVYKPTLWYFHKLNFLKNQRDCADCTPAFEESTKSSFLIDEPSQPWEPPESQELLEPPEPPVKKTKPLEIKNNSGQLEYTSRLTDKRKPLVKKKPLEKRKQWQRVHTVEEVDNVHIERVPEYQRRSNDDTGILAQGWASQYAELTNRQRIFARKIFSDVLFCGCLGGLNENTVEDINTVLKEYTRSTASPLFEECAISPPHVANQQFLNDDYKVSRSSED